MPAIRGIKPVTSPSDARALLDAAGTSVLEFSVSTSLASALFISVLLASVRLFSPPFVSILLDSTPFCSNPLSSSHYFVMGSRSRFGRWLARLPTFDYDPSAEARRRWLVAECEYRRSRSSWYTEGMEPSAIQRYRAFAAEQLRRITESVRNNRASFWAPEVTWDGKSVWVNDREGHCLGRFGRRGVDVHRTAFDQASGLDQCLDCHPGASADGWRRFCASMLQHHGVRIPQEAKPRWLQAEDP